MSKLDILITRIFIQLGFLVAAGALLPALLDLLQFSQRQLWRLPSIDIPALSAGAKYAPAPQPTRHQRSHDKVNELLANIRPHWRTQIPRQMPCSIIKIMRSDGHSK